MMKEGCVLRLQEIRSAAAGSVPRPAEEKGMAGNL
jgi:hypothetical protein